MATNDVLIDIEATAALILVGTTGVSDISELPKDVVDAGRRVIDRVLRGFNKKYADLLDKSKADLASLKSSLDKQINDLNAQIKTQKESKEEAIEKAVAFYKSQRDEVTRVADAERMAIEKERADLEKKKEEAKAEVEKYKRDAGEAVRIQGEAEQALIEERENIKVLNDEIRRLERANSNLQAESQSWEREASNTATLRENAEAALDQAREEAGRIKQRTQELQREVDKLKPELKRAHDQILDQGKKLKTCKEQLKDAKEELHNLQPETPAGTPRSSTKAPSPLSDRASSNKSRGGDLQSDRSGSSPKSNLSRTDPLQRAEERYQELAATITTDYIPRTEHEQAIADKTKELENLKVERGNVKKAEANCQAALKKLQDELAKKEEENKLVKKDAARVEELQARIKELEKKIAALEAEAKTHQRDNAKQIDRIRDLERQLKAARESIADREKKLKQDKARIADLEKRELQQQRTITSQQTKIADLKNAANAGVRDAPGSDKDDKDNEIKRLSDDLARAQNDLVAARQDADDTAAELDREREALRELQGRYDELQGQLDNTESERKRLEDTAGELEKLNVELEERKREHTLLRNQITKLQQENRRLAAENRGTGDERHNDCERDRERLQAENKRLQDEIQRLQDQIVALGGGDDSAAENRRLRERINDLAAANKRLGDLNRALQDEIETIRRERLALRDELANQERVINGNGEQADRTQAALDEQITILHQAQLELSRHIEDLSQNNIQQGRLAAETNRALGVARDDIRTYQNLIQALTIERDLLQDEVRMCVEAQQRARQRARENAAVTVNPETRPVVPAPPRPNFFVRTYNYASTVLSYTAVWTTLVVVLVMMLAIIIAEGRRYAEWTAANEHSRALYMALQRKPKICLSPPTMDYFWHTVGMVLIGRWSFR